MRRSGVLGVLVAAAALAVAAFSFWFLRPLATSDALEERESAGARRARATAETSEEFPDPATVSASEVAVASRVAAPDPDSEKTRVESDAPAALDSLLVVGHVHGLDGSPLQSAHVAWWIEERDALSKSIEAWSERDGGYSADLSALITERRPKRTWRATLVGRATVARFHAAEVRQPISARSSPQIELDFTLERGATLRGRVVDEHGEPVSCAELQMSDGESLKESTTSIEDGRFEFPIRIGGEWRLVARSRVAGVAAVRVPGLLTSRDLMLPDLVLETGGVIEGHVEDRFGNPIDDLLIRADLMPSGSIVAGTEARRSAELHSSGDPQSIQNIWRACDPSNSSRWFTSTTTRTDSNGDFHFAGLVPSRVMRYFLHTDESPLFVAASGERYCDVGSTGARFIAERLRLQVIVTDERGAPRRNAVVAIEGLRIATSRVRELGDGAVTSIVNDEWHRVDDDGAWTTTVGSDQERLVVARVPRIGSAEAKVRIDSSRSLTRVELVVRDAAAAHATLRFTARTDEGAAVDALRGQLLFPDLEPVRSIHAERGSDGLIVSDAPVGRFRLAASAAGAAHEIAGLSMCSPSEVSAPFEIAPDATTTVPVVFRRGARVRLMLRTDARRPVSLSNPTAILVRDGGGRFTLGPFVRESSGAPASLTTDTWLVAEPLLETGLYTLFLSLPGFAILERDFAAHPGELAELDATLEPE